MSSRLPEFYRLTLADRKKRIAAFADLSLPDMDLALVNGGLDEESADKAIENVIGRYALPFSIGLNLRLNHHDVLAPMVIEEPSVVAAVGNAAKWVRRSGGFEAEADPPIMIGQLALHDVDDATATEAAIHRQKKTLLELARKATPGLCERGGGPRDLIVIDLGDGIMAIHLTVDCVDAMGANAVNTALEAMAPTVRQHTNATVGVCILSNLSDQRCVRVRCAIESEELATQKASGKEVCARIARASLFARKSPHRATTHNKGLMNGVDAVVVATGNDWRAVEAGAHAYAARSGRYQPLCGWTYCKHQLIGELEMPLALGLVGGIARIHRGAALAQRILSCGSAQELAMVAASVGMASNLAALHALCTHGIQHGHMALHARSLAVAVGATGDQVETIAARLQEQGTISLSAAEALFAKQSSK